MRSALRRLTIAGVACTLTTSALVVGATSADAATTAPSTRTFSCSGVLDAVPVTVTGSLSPQHRPSAVKVTGRAGGVLASAIRVSKIGASTVHTGYTAWNVSGRQAAGDVYVLSIPPVLPGGGGFFDADLEIRYAGGANGSVDVVMTNCTVSGAAVQVSRTRTLTCTGTPAEPTTKRTVTGVLDRKGVLSNVTVTDSTGTALSARSGPALKVGPSQLTAGFTQWDITGANAAPDLYYLHVPPVLPDKGGFVNATLEIAFDGGNLGGWQIDMTDCTVR